MTVLWNTQSPSQILIIYFMFRCLGHPIRKFSKTCLTPPLFLLMSQTKKDGLLKTWDFSLSQTHSLNFQHKQKSIFLSRVLEQCLAKRHTRRGLEVCSQQAGWVEWPPSCTSSPARAHCQEHRSSPERQTVRSSPNTWTLICFLKCQVIFFLSGRNCCAFSNLTVLLLVAVFPELH